MSAPDDMTVRELVEYLCTVGGLDLSGLLADEVTEAVAWNEMMEWWGRLAGR